MRSTICTGSWLAQELNQLLFWRALDSAWPVSVDLASKIRDVPDFPKPGIVFKDIMPLLADPQALVETIDRLAEWAEPRKPDLILGAEARGYITGGALACRLGCGFVAARKPGKLPWRTVAAKYALEYGFDSLEVHADAIVTGQRVIIHDDVLATANSRRRARGAPGEGSSAAVHHRTIPQRRPARRLSLINTERCTTR